MHSSQSIATNTRSVDPKMNFLSSVKGRLQSMLDERVEALPKDFNQSRFIQNAMVALNDVRDIQNLNPDSIPRTLLKGAFLGLDFLNGECYAIPYKGQLTFQTGYKGEIKLARQKSVLPIKDIYAKLVREDDDFEEVIEHGKQYINFKPRPFGNSDIIGAFAVVIYDNDVVNYVTMSKEEILDIRNRYSQSYQYKAKSGKGDSKWQTDEGQMFLKTVLKRLTKTISLDLGTEQVQALKEGSDMTFDQKPKEALQATSSLDIQAEPQDKEEILIAAN